MAIRWSKQATSCRTKTLPVMPASRLQLFATKSFGSTRTKSMFGNIFAKKFVCFPGAAPAYTTRLPGLPSKMFELKMQMRQMSSQKLYQNPAEIQSRRKATSFVPSAAHCGSFGFAKSICVGGRLPSRFDKEAQKL